MLSNMHEQSGHNLPSQPTPFIGRQAELSEFARLLTELSCRLLTLCGPGGVGKTRLAIEIGRQNIAYFTDGVWMAELESVSVTNDIIPAILTALRLQLQDGRDLLQQLCDYLSRRQMLLILDNFEHLLDGTDLVVDLLEAAPGLKIVATSREALKLREEWVRQVRGLEVPEDEQIEDLENYSAIQLFVEGASRVQGDFSLADEKANIVQLCQMVEGLPLALELAASWLKVMPFSMIIKEMEHSLDLLESPLGNMPARHRSMRVVFDQSWRLLTDKEQAVFMKLAVFRGGFFREAAAVVCEATLLTLSNLVDKGLLRVNAKGRYHLHSLVRQYAEEKLKLSASDYTTICDLHCKYYTEFLYERRSDVWRTDSLELRDEIGIELDNSRTAFEWALEHRNTAQISKAVSTFTEVCYQRSLWREGYALYGRIVVLARSTSNDGLLWQVLASQGWFAHWLCDFEQAARLYNEAFTIGHRSGWQGNVAFKDFLMLRLSEMAMRQGDLEKARQYAEELAANPTDDTLPVWTLETQGRIEHLAGNYQKAKNVLQEALTVAHSSKNITAIVVVSNHLGYVYVDQRKYTAAQQAFEESLSYSQEFDYQRAVVRSLVGLGKVAFYLGKSDVAWSYFAQAVEKGRQIGHNLEILNAIIGVASLSATTGSEDFALELLLFAHQHSAADWEARKKSKQLLDKLERTSSSDVIEYVRDRARTLDLYAIVDRILAAYPLSPHVSTFTETSYSERILALNQSLSEPLTRREIEVLELIADGNSNRQIADQLFIGVNTVKKHVTHILSKLGVNNRIHAISRLLEL